MGHGGQHLPIDAMIDFGVDEIWIIEIFPKFRQRVPKTLGEREHGKDPKPPQWLAVIRLTMHHIFESPLRSRTVGFPSSVLTLAIRQRTPSIELFLCPFKI